VQCRPPDRPRALTWTKTPSGRNNYREVIVRQNELAASLHLMSDVAGNSVSDLEETEQEWSKDFIDDWCSAVTSSSIKLLGANVQGDEGSDLRRRKR